MGKAKKDRARQRKEKRFNPTGEEEVDVEESGDEEVVNLPLLEKLESTSEGLCVGMKHSRFWLSIFCVIFCLAFISNELY
jgi:hypothetical protein